MFAELKTQKENEFWIGYRLEFLLYTCNITIELRNVPKQKMSLNRLKNNQKYR